MHIKGRLKELREAKKLSQSEIAQILNVDQTSYSNYEIGKHKIPSNILIDLSNFYNVSIDYLVGLTNNPAKYPTK